MLIGGGVAGAGVAAGGGAWALKRGGTATSASGPGPSPSPTVGASAATAAPTITAPAIRGGVARVVAAESFNFDTFDAQRTGEVSVAEVLGRTHSRLVEWSGFPDATVRGDLAARWEQPDATTWTFQLAPGVRWQEREPLNGRSLTAEDVVAHFQRTIALAASGGLPMAQRGSDFAGIRRVSASDAATVVFEGERPDPFMLDTLAGRFALLQAPETVAKFGDSWSDQKPEQVVGSGPFTYGGEGDGVLRFAAWGGGHRSAFVDGIEVSEAGRDIDSFVAKRVDEFLSRDRRDTLAIRGKALATVDELSRYEDSPVLSTFSTAGPPWNNAALVQAISVALNRGALSAGLFGGRADACGPVGPATPGFALNESALAAFGGYGADAAKDAADARARWSAAGGPALGTVTIDFPSIFDPLYSASSVVTAMLNSVLGGQFRAAIDTYTSISQKVADGQYGNGRAAFWFGWAPPLRSPDPSREFIATFDQRVNGAGGGSAQSAVLSSLFDTLLSTNDMGSRAEVAMAASKMLLSEGGPVVPWLLQRSELFRWDYLKRREQTPFWTQQADYEMTVNGSERGRG